MVVPFLRLVELVLLLEKFFGRVVEEPKAFVGEKHTRSHDGKNHK
jgi:hypothetical protein